MNRRLQRPKKRGRPKVTIAALSQELETKKEILDRMEECLGKMRCTDKIQISESDLEEFDDLLSSGDDELENPPSGNSHCKPLRSRSTWNENSICFQFQIRMLRPCQNSMKMTN